MTTAYTPSQADQDAVLDLQSAVYSMIMEVASAQGAGHAYKGVLAFQQTWNDHAAEIDRVLKATGQGSFFKLVEDGLYGPNTGHALALTTGVSTPSKTYGLVAWYTANKNLIDSYAGSLPGDQSSSSSYAVQQAGSAVDPNSVKIAAENVSLQAQSGSVVTQNIPPQQGNIPYQGQVVDQSSVSDTAESKWSPVISDSDLSVVDEIHGAVYTMTMAIIGGVNSEITPAISAFQVMWNQSKAPINRILTAVGSPKLWFKVRQDGKYDAGTARALGLATSTTPPYYKNHFAGWYKKNRKLIDSYAKLAKPVVISSSPISSMNVVNSSSSGAGIQSKVDSQAQQDIEKLTSDVIFSDERVPVSKPESNFKYIAIAVGLVAAGGTFAFMTRSKRSRRYA